MYIYIYMGIFILTYITKDRIFCLNHGSDSHFQLRLAIFSIKYIAETMVNKILTTI